MFAEQAMNKIEGLTFLSTDKIQMIKESLALSEGFKSELVDLINNKDTIKHLNKFDLSQLKIEHFYCFDDPKSGDPFSTSIELNFNYDEGDNINVTKNKPSLISLSIKS